MLVIDFIFDTLEVALAITLFFSIMFGLAQLLENVELFILSLLHVPLAICLIWILFACLGTAQGLTEVAYAWVACDEDRLNSAYTQYRDHFNEVRSIDLEGPAGYQIAKDHNLLRSALLEEAESCRIPFSRLETQAAYGRPLVY